jgi:hypothetical protein
MTEVVEGPPARTQEGRKTGAGKWAQAGVPHRGWSCIAIRDDGEQPTLCQMCELQTVRFVHVMQHPDYPETLNVGRLCAASMEREYAPPARQPEVNGDTVKVVSALHGERIFYLVRMSPYRRKDGTETAIKVWQGSCVVCGAPFEVATPQNATGSKSFATTTCQAHRRQTKRCEASAAATG